MAFELTDSNFKENVLESEGVSLVDFWAEWCGPCRMVGPIVDELSTEYEGKALVGKVDVDTNPDITMQYGVRSIPTLLVFKDGQVVDKHVGVATKQALSEKLDKFIAVAS
ncbi:MAG: thioredoxin [Bacteroidota bacterium]